MLHQHQHLQLLKHQPIQEHLQQRQLRQQQILLQIHLQILQPKPVHLQQRQLRLLQILLLKQEPKQLHPQIQEQQPVLHLLQLHLHLHLLKQQQTLLLKQLHLHPHRQKHQLIQ